jgi:hypothetical protein
MFVSWFLSFPAVVMPSLPNLDFQAPAPRDDTTDRMRKWAVFIEQWVVKEAA